MLGTIDSIVAGLYIYIYVRASKIRAEFIGCALDHEESTILPFYHHCQKKKGKKRKKEKRTRKRSKEFHQGNKEKFQVQKYQNHIFGQQKPKTASVFYQALPNPDSSLEIPKIPKFDIVHVSIDIY